MKPILIRGSYNQDHRGTVRFNNNFVPLGVKRIYTIENADVEFVRSWQGHQIEQRWFSPITGSFIIKLIEIDDWSKPSKQLPILEFHLESSSLDVLHVPPGFLSSIQSKEDSSKLLVLADYKLGEIKDEHRFPNDYFRF